jgi:4-hydroxy-tetrahydrodipicolinate reductase
MDIAIIGYGKMGRLIEAKALEYGHRVVAVVDPFAEASARRVKLYRTIAEVENLGDVAIEFTRPDTAVQNITALAAKKVPAVVGTTGWYERLPEVQRMIEEAGSSLLWASNFSLGVNLFYRIAVHAASLIDPFPEYDVGGWEAHHNQKADSPSGTAKTLVERVLAVMKRKKTAVWGLLADRPPAPEELHYPSLRLGALPGVHTLVFDSLADTIEIRHTARNREGLVAGAILAAQWLTGSRRRGVFTIDDVLGT